VPVRIDSPLAKNGSSFALCISIHSKLTCRHFAWMLWEFFVIVEREPGTRVDAFGLKCFHFSESHHKILRFFGAAKRECP